MSILQALINTKSLFEPLLTSREAARLHYKALEVMACAVAVPAMKKVKSWVFRLSRLSEWIDQELESKAAPEKSSPRISRMKPE